MLKSIKNYLSQLFKKEDREKGLGMTGLILTTIVVTTAVTGTIAAWFTGGSLVSGVGWYLGIIFTALGSSLVQSTSGWLTYTLSPSFTSTSNSVTNDPIFQNAWTSVRDLTNMLIVLGFVAIGIATTLRIKEYEAKNTLFRIILVALLINFSGLLCSTMVQAGDTVTTALLAQGSASGNFQAITNAINKYVQSALGGGTLGAEGVMTSQEDAAKNPWKYLVVCLTLAGFEFFTAYIFLILAILMSARYAMLAVFYILSPLAFFCWTFPKATGKYWTMWWENFIKWSFMGVLISFFIYLAVNVLSKAGNTISYTQMCVSFIFLYMGYKAAKQGSAIGAQAVLGLASAAVGFATGAVVGTVGGGALGGAMGALRGAQSGAKSGGPMSGALGGAAAGGKAAVSAGLNAVGSGAVRGLEGLGMLKVGTAAKLTQSKLGEEQKRYEAMFTSGNATDEAKAQRAAKLNGREGAAAYSAAVATDNLNKTFMKPDGTPNLEGIYQGNLNAKQFGKGDLMKSAVKQNYELAGFDRPKIEGVRDARRITYDQAKFKVEQEALADALPQMSTAQVGAINEDHVRDYDFFKKNFNARTVEKMQVSKNPVLLNTVRGHIAAIKAERDSHTETDPTTSKVTIKNQSKYNQLDDLLGEMNKLPNNP